MEMLRVAVLQVCTAVNASLFKYIGIIFSKICQSHEISAIGKLPKQYLEQQVCSSERLSM